MRVECLAQEHNTLSPARVRTRTGRSGVERTNHEATAPLTFDRLHFNFLAFAWRGIYMMGERAFMLIKKWLASRNLAIWTVLVLEKVFNVFEFLDREILAFVVKLSDRCFCWFPAAMLMGISMASPYKPPSVWVEFSPHIFYKISDLNLGKRLCILRFWTLSIERFWFLFWPILNCVTLKTSNSTSGKIDFACILLIDRSL